MTVLLAHLVMTRFPLVGHASKQRLKDLPTESAACHPARPNPARRKDPADKPLDCLVSAGPPYDPTDRSQLEG